MNSVPSIMLLAFFGAIGALIAVVIACRISSGLWHMMLLLLALVLVAPAAYLFVAFHPELVDGRYRTYRAFYRDIQPGMTREQVFAALERRYPKTGKRQRPKLIGNGVGGVSFFMNPETSREPNCEGIFVNLDDAGNVVGKTYSRD